MNTRFDMSNGEYNNCIPVFTFILLDNLKALQPISRNARTNPISS